MVYTQSLAAPPYVQRASASVRFLGTSAVSSSVRGFLCEGIRLGSSEEKKSEKTDLGIKSSGNFS